MTQVLNKNQSGFTLIELMVSAVILGLSITGIMTMLSVGRTLETEDGLNRQARINAANALEDSNFQSAKYPLPAPSANATTGNLIAGAGSLVPYTQIQSTLEGTPLQWTDGNDPTHVSTVAVPYQTRTVFVSWSVAGATQSLTIIKSLAGIN